MANKIQLRRDTAANWSRINPILADGELGLDITNNKIKAGDGTTTWASLDYLASEDSANLVAGQYAVTLGTDGVLTVPGTVSSSNGVTLSTGRGDIQLGVNLEAPGVPTHFHINKAGADAGNMDLILGDDANYVKLPSIGGVVITADSDESWEFNTNGTLILPPGGVVTTHGASDGVALGIIDVEVDPQNGFQITVTVDTAHGLADGNKIEISGITTTTELNSSYYVRPGGNNDFILYHDVDLNNTVSGDGFTAYSSLGNRPLTQASGNGVTQVTDDSPWGAGYNSIRLNGGGWLQANASSDFNIGTGDFAVSFWVKQIEYTNAPRLFSFGSWPTETLGISSEGSTNLYVWINGSIANQGGNNGITLDPDWNHILLTRYLGHLYLNVNGTTIFDDAADTINLSAAGTKNLIIGNQQDLSAGLNGFFRDFKFDVGQGINPATYTVPTGPATGNAYTKILVVGNDNFLDSAGAYSTGGGGTMTYKIRSSDIVLTVEGAPNGSDAGDIRLTSGSGSTQFKLDGIRDRIAVMDPGGDWPINTTGQHNILFDITNIDTTVTVANQRINVIYIWTDTTSSNQQNVSLPTPAWPGVEMTVINESALLVTIIGWDGPPYTMQAYDTIKLISYRSPMNQLYWWVTSAWVW